MELVGRKPGGSVRSHEPFKRHVIEIEELTLVSESAFSYPAGKKRTSASPHEALVINLCPLPSRAACAFTRRGMPKLMLIPVAPLPDGSTHFGVCDLPQHPPFLQRLLENVNAFPLILVLLVEEYPTVANKPGIINTKALPAFLSGGSEFYITLKFTRVVQHRMTIAVV
jgi:hypothetical protein